MFQFYFKISQLSESQEMGRFFMDVTVKGPAEVVIVTPFQAASALPLVFMKVSAKAAFFYSVFVFKHGWYSCATDSPTTGLLPSN